MKRKISTFTYLMLLMSFSGIVVAANSQSAGASSVEGVITSDTIWALTNSPYEVVGDVTIINGVTLTIEPGVEILFETGSSLIVNGNLHAVGTSANRIRLRSIRSEPVAGDWNGIKFYADYNSTLTMSFCDVEYARNAITVDSLGIAVIEKSTISNNSESGIQIVGTANLLARDNTIRLNTNGISGSGITCSGMKIINNYISYNENGVNLFVYGVDGRINNVTISGNAFDKNMNGIYLHSNAPKTTEANTYINYVTISNNWVRYSEYGIRLLAEGWGGGGLVGGGPQIYSSLISSNNISFSKNAVHVKSSGEWFSWISNLTISKNTIHSSDNGIFLDAFRAPQPPILPIPFDVILVDNTISANNKGVSILGDVRANFTRNSVSYNTYGIYLNSSVPSENTARSNDVYRNTAYGVYVLRKASIDAKYNYWGASSGPYHEILWPSGEGDRVYGENVDFMPFLPEPFGAINDPPFAVLKADKTTVVVNQTVAFHGYESSDDSSIINFFFDFGDGETTQGSAGVARHKYASPGTYIISLVVMDDLGVNSTNRATKTITVSAMPSLAVGVLSSPLTVVSERTAVVEVHVEAQVGDEFVGVEGVFIELMSDQDGEFEPSSGYTDSNGDFNSTLSAPSVSEATTMRIVATASKEGYRDGSGEVILQVFSRPEVRPDSAWMWLAAIASVVVIAVVVRAVVKRRVKAKPRGKRQRAST